MIGICIKYMHENYGGILQAFATVSFCEKNDLDYELIRYVKKKTLKEKLLDIPRIFNVVWFNSRIEGIQRKISLKTNNVYAECDAVRMQEFKRFINKSFTKFSEEYVGYKNLCKGSEKYNAVITGSDQLWSPAGLPTNYYNLKFVPDNKLKISIASSFGVKDIPWYQKRRTKEFLERLDYISMRENRGSEIVKELTGKAVPTILDPVFYLSREEWLEKIPNERLYKNPYIFVYFLGTNKKHREAVIEFSRKNNLKIVALKHMDQYVKYDEQFGDYAPYNVGPDDFLNLIRNAEYIFTDSFHGMAFSILNQKQFVVFDRYSENAKHSKNSRIDTLCTNFGIEDKRFKEKRSLEEIILSPIDYEKVDEKYKEQKKSTDQYMNEVVNAIRKVEM